MDDLDIAAGGVQGEVVGKGGVHGGVGVHDLQRQELGLRGDAPGSPNSND